MELKQRPCSEFDEPSLSMALASAGTLGHHYNCNGSRIELGGELLHVRHAHLRSTLEPMLFAAGPGDGLIGPAARNLEQRHPDPLDFGRKSGPGKNYVCFLTRSVPVEG